jgi:roadblock/LC7 domain-containing protein
MTESQNHKQEIMKLVEKGAVGSKKFLAFLITEALLFTIAIAALKWQPDLGWPLAATMLAIVLIMGFVAVAFNTNQAKLDSYVRVAALAAGKMPKGLDTRMNLSVENSEESRNDEPNNNA